MGILKIENVSFSYNKEKKALNNISLNIEQGERIIILGNNGAGKSTLFLCCNGVLKPQSGKIFLNDKLINNTKNDKLELAKNIGIVFQNADEQIIANTVEAEVSFGPINLGWNDKEVEKETESAITVMNLSNLKFESPFCLSNGQKKRVTIADILAMKSKVLFFDEPSAGLDYQNLIALEKELKKLSDMGLGLIISTHDMDFAWRFADRVIILNAGQIVADDKAEKILTDENLLKLYNFSQPILVKVAKLYNIFPYPKTFEELEDIVNNKL